jgi:hypothetical protein
MRFVLLAILSSMAWGQVASMAPINPAQGQTRKAQPVGDEKLVDANSLLPELKAPSGEATLVGGTITRLDRVRNEVTIRPFGGDEMRVLFDGRTQVWRDDSKGSPRDLRTGEKAYVDTVLDGSDIFAKNIRVVSQQPSGDVRGQVVGFDRARGELTVKDRLSPELFKIRIVPGTKVLKDGQEATTSILLPQTLVAVQFRPAGKGTISADQIDVLAEPGATFTFFGRVVFLDLHQGIMSIVDPRDRKNYEVHFNPAAVKINGELQIDSEVTVDAVFDGTRYVTSAIMVKPSES